jgi:hypothetical protein
MSSTAPTDATHYPWCTDARRTTTGIPGREPIRRPRSSSSPGARACQIQALPEKKLSGPRAPGWGCDGPAGGYLRAA